MLKQNELIDDELGQVDYRLEDINLEYITTSWFWKEEQSAIVVFGGNNWLTHYTLHFLTQYQHQVPIVFMFTSIPNFVNKPRYSDIDTVEIATISESKTYFEKYKPQVVLYTDYERNVAEFRFAKLYTKNVLQIEKLCEILSTLSYCRLILFSDDSIYAKDQSEEDVKVMPQIPLGQSFEEMEQVSAAHHKKQALEIYSLRIAPVYGNHINDGAMRLLDLLANGYVLGPIETLNEVSLVSIEDVMVSAFLVMIAPQPGYKIFNVTEPPVKLNRLLRILDEKIPKTKLLGIQCKLANILGIGYQNQISMSEEFFRYMCSFFEYSNDFLNQLRFEQKEYKLNKYIATYILNLSSISNKRFKDTFGWAPSRNTQQKITTCQKKPTSQKHFHYDDYTQNILLPAYDNAANIAEELFLYTKSLQKKNKYLTLQTLDLPTTYIDIQSLYIFFQEIWSSIPSLLGKSSKKQFIPELIPEILQTIVQILRYEHSVVQRKFPQDNTKQIFNLTQRLGEFNSHMMRYFCNFAFISKAILWANKHMAICNELLQIIPDKNIGFFIESDLGDIAIQIKIKNQKIVIRSFRKEIDSFPRAWSFEKKLNEFKKSANLYLTLGFYLKPLIRDALASDFIKRYLYNLGKYYFIQELERKYIDALIQKVSHESMNAYYLFLDNTPQVQIGFMVTSQGITKINSSFLKMVNELIKTTDNLEELSQLLGEQTNKLEKYVFLRIRTVKKLLSSKFSTMLLKWLLGNSKLGDRK